MLYFDVTTNVKKKGSHGINIGGLVQLDVIKIFEFKADWIENPGIGYWKKFPEKSMSHAAFLGKKWVSTHEIQLEIVYKKTLSDDPKLRNLEKAWKKIRDILCDTAHFWKQFPKFAYMPYSTWVNLKYIRF